MMNNTAEVILQLIKELKVSVTRSSIISELSKHPQNNSLQGISDLLSNWNIPNGAYEISTQELISNSSLTPCIAHLSVHNGEFVLVHNIINHLFVTISAKGNNKSEITFEQFHADYSGTILIAEKAEISGEADYRSKRIHEIISEVRFPFVGICLILIVAAYIWNRQSAQSSILIQLLLSIKGLGLIVSLVLLAYLIDTN